MFLWFILFATLVIYSYARQKYFTHRHIYDQGDLFVQQCQNLLLDMFGFIAFDYDLETLDSSNMAENNELTHALQHLLNAFQTIFYLSRLAVVLYSMYRAGTYSTGVESAHRSRITIMPKHIGETVSFDAS
jgi:hypothetical protein